MIKRRHLNSVDEFEELLKQSKLLNRFSINRLGLFGSFLRDEQANDIDLLIDEDISLEKAMQFQQALEGLIDNRLDIMIKRFANPIILSRAKKEMRYVEG